ncbi:MAG: YigZ family protein [Eubacteriales bacterium]|nr:YigZ family protein [Eubacteriales bacterium]
MAQAEQKNGYRTVLEGGEGRYEEKKSVFIATVRPVADEAEAQAFIEEMKKKYWDARHNCSAFVLGDRSEMMRSSDDGEPSGTAGRPILDVILGAGLTYTAIVVTRYFGGVLLGTGGLVRAYTEAARDGIAESITAEKIWGSHLQVHLNYTDVGKMQYLLAQAGIPTLHSEYTDTVTLEIIMPETEENRFRKQAAEATAGRADIEKVGSTFYCEADGQILLG